MRIFEQALLSDFYGCHLFEKERSANYLTGAQQGVTSCAGRDEQHAGT